MSMIVVGTCSLCGGQVATHSNWMSVVPEIPTCLQCGARAASHGPVIPMQAPSSPIRTFTGTNTKEPT